MKSEDGDVVTSPSISRLAALSQPVKCFKMSVSTIPLLFPDAFGCHFRLISAFLSTLKKVQIMDIVNKIILSFFVDFM